MTILEKPLPQEIDLTGFFSDDDDPEDDPFVSQKALSKKRSAPSSPAVAPKKLRQSSPEPSPAAVNLATSLARDVLCKTWGYPGFRLLQEQAIVRLIEGKSAVVVFPTGGGKSLVYQVPALAFDEWEKSQGSNKGKGVTLVISPLIALMKDQVDALRKKGVCAAAIDSSQSRQSVLNTYDDMRTGKLKLLYVAPERLNNEGFVEQIKDLRVRLLAIDEAHCISEWGHAFRPDYLKIARFAKEIEAERVLCLTATATPMVCDDICNSFDIPKDSLFKTATFRANLSLLASSVDKEQQKEALLKDFLRKNPGPTIVYVATHKQTEIVTNMLRSDGFRVESYHAGMSSEQRTEVQDRFILASNIVIVATIAFGMGIDKANIRTVVHYTVPKSLEGYSQEIGRAGRDDKPSACMAYLCPDDLHLLENFSRADICSERSIRGWLKELIEENKDVQEGDVVEGRIYSQSKDWDIRATALTVMYATLELHFGLIRAITPRYNKYQYTCGTSYYSCKKTDKSELAKAIFRIAKDGKKNTSLDVDQVATRAGVTREDVVRKLQIWHSEGAIELKPSEVVSRYRVLKSFPKGPELEAVIKEMFQQMVDKEKKNIERIRMVISTLASGECYAVALSRYFGDEVSNGKCGQCGYCTSGKKLEFVERKENTPIDPKLVEKILKVTDLRDDARFLARVGWGISSPRITKEGLGKVAVFGSMEGCDFEELMKEFQKVCSG